MLCKLTGAPAELNYRASNNPTLVRNRIGSVTRAATEIGFTAKLSLEDGLKRLIEWKNRDARPARVRVDA
jgi:UDP-glucose 4-epimerase